LKPDFDKCEKMATKLLLMQDIHSLSIDVKSLVFDKNIIIDSIQNYCRITDSPLFAFIKNEVLKDGCTLIYRHNSETVYIVLYNEEIRCKERLNWTLAHEIGHIYLGHKHDGTNEEIEAHYFAAQLLMPEIVIREFKQRCPDCSYEDIYMMFNVSITAAQKRADTIRRKSIYFDGKDEHILLNKCIPFMNQYIRFRKYFKVS
jgi:Zn-dependent peptidase ImmA (M78 family)